MNDYFLSWVFLAVQSMPRASLKRLRDAAQYTFPDVSDTAIERAYRAALRAKRNIRQADTISVMTTKRLLGAIRFAAESLARSAGTRRFFYWQQRHAALIAELERRNSL